MIAISNHVFSFEPVLRWYDEWLPVHQRTPEPAHLKKLTQPDANPEGRALVEKIRSEVVSLFRRAWCSQHPDRQDLPLLCVAQPRNGSASNEFEKRTGPKGPVKPGCSWSA